MSRSNHPSVKRIYRPTTLNASPGGAGSSGGTPSTVTNLGTNDLGTTTTSTSSSTASYVFDTGYNTATSNTQQFYPFSVTGVQVSSSNPPAAITSTPPPSTYPTRGTTSSNIVSPPQVGGLHPQGNPSNSSSSASNTTQGPRDTKTEWSQRLSNPMLNPPRLPVPISFSSGGTTPITGGTTPITVGTIPITVGTTPITFGTVTNTGGTSFNFGRTTPSIGGTTRTTMTASPFTFRTSGNTPITQQYTSPPPPLSAPAVSMSDPVLDSLANLTLNTSNSRARQNNNNSLPVFSDAELETLRSLSGLISQLHADTGGCRRIQRGSPGAGSLSGSMTPSKERFNRIKPEIEAIIAGHDQSTGMVKFKTLFNEFDNVVSEFVNERGYDDGYTDRVRYLERINYASGRLKGMIEAILEGIWITGGNEPVVIARTLNFSETESELPVGEELEELLSREDCYQHGEIHIDLNLSSTLCSNFSQFMENDTNTDVTFCVGIQSIRAHRVILAAQSDYFKSLLFGSMREAEPNCDIPLKDISMATLQLLIRFAYCGRVQLKNVSLQGVLKLLEAADRFCFIKLKDSLISQLSSLINSSTVIQLLVSAFNLNIPGLQETCFKVADDNAEQLVDCDSLISLPSEILAMILTRDTFIVEETKIYDVIKRWMRKNQDGSTQCPPPGLVSCIRPTLMPQASLVDLSDSDGLFTDKEILSAIKAQTKLCWERMNPRGIKAENNLFADKKCSKVTNTVMWSSPPPPVIGAATGLHLGSANVPFHGHPNGRLCDAVISSQSTRNATPGLLGMGQRGALAQGPVTQQNLSVDIKFNNTYRINYVKFEPYPNDTNSNKRGFSYTIQVSLNGTDWKPLLDFSKYMCYGKQQLCLPIIAAKCLKFNLCSVKDVSVPFKVTFSECSFREQVKSKPYIIKDNIIVLPGSFVKCPFNEEWYLNEHGDHACTVNLRMPTFTKYVRMKLKGTCATNTTGDVQVVFNSNESTSTTVQNVLLNSSDDSNDLIEVSLPMDTVVHTITLKIINVVQIDALNTSSTATITYNLLQVQLKSE